MRQSIQMRWSPFLIVFLLGALAFPLMGVNRCGYQPPKLLRVYNLHADVLGSVGLITSEPGPVTDPNGVFERTTHTPYGDISARVGNRTEGFPEYSYTGQEYDPESGLHYFRARYYDTKVGRFLSPDRALNDGGESFDRVGAEPQALNAYAYSYNRPTVFVDPSGEVPVPVILAAGWVIANWSTIVAVGAGIGAGAATFDFASTLIQTGDFHAAAQTVVDPATGFGGGAARLFKRSNRAASAVRFNTNAATPAPQPRSRSVPLLPARAGGTSGNVGLLPARTGRTANSFSEFKARGAPFESTTTERAAWRAYRQSSSSAQELVIGRQPDTEAGERLGMRRLNDPDWDSAYRVNDAWIQGGIDAGKPFYLGSEPGYRNFYNDPGSRFPTTVFYREWNQLLDAGYHRVGNYMFPPTSAGF